MVYFRIQGNLGNVLFQRAAAMSLKRGRVVGVGDSSAIEKLRSYGRLFKDIEIVPSPPPDAVVVRQEKCLPVVFPVDDGRDLFIDGYFQSENYFDRNLVYDWVKPSISRVERLQQKYGDWLNRPNVTGISVRRGDYLQKGDFHPFVGTRYLRDCVNRISESVDFIVCSDGIDWCERFFSKSFPRKNFLFIKDEDALDQLAIQMLCSNNIISNSSFSWWGAWIANERRRRTGVAGRSLAPSMWFGYAVKRDGATWDDVYFEDMEVVHNCYSLRGWLAAHWTFLSEKV